MKTVSDLNKDFDKFLQFVDAPQEELSTLKELDALEAFIHADDNLINAAFTPGLFPELDKFEEFICYGKTTKTD